MNIAILDFNYTKNHYKFNVQIIKQIATFANVISFVQKDYYESKEFCENNVELIELNLPLINSNPLKNRILMYKNAKIQIKAMKDYNIDAVVILAFEEISYAFINKFFSVPVFLFHHQNTDGINSSLIKRFFFNFYKNKVWHISLDKFIKEGIIGKLKVQSERVINYNHPNVFPLDKNLATCKKDLDVKNVISISNLNCQNVINEIVNFENENKILQKNKIKWVIKSKEKEFNNDFLYVFKGYLDSEKYDEYFQNADLVVLFYEPTYQYRMSGGLMETLNLGKPVVFLNSMLGEIFSVRYPSMVFNVHTIEELFNFIIDFHATDTNHDIEKFKEDYQCEECVKELKNKLSVLI